jgi:Tat protein secretion system quality control protein TatD with DNase activity
VIFPNRQEGKIQINMDTQKYVFERQLRVSLLLNKPVVIHCREAEDEAYEIMSQVIYKKK